MLSNLLEDPEFKGQKIESLLLLVDNPTHKQPITEKYSKDFGNIVNHIPAGVFMPSTTAELQVFMRLAKKHQVKITCRGTGGSTCGFSQCQNGIIIDLSNLDSTLKITTNKDGQSFITVPAHVTWLDAFQESLKHDLTILVPIDYLNLSAGGTLSMGGVGGGTHRYGSLADNVVNFTIVTMNGENHFCTSDQNSELFNAALCGLGQFGIITEATLPLVKAKKLVKQYLLRYESLSQFLTDQMKMYDIKYFDHLKGFIDQENGKWRYTIEVAKFFDAETESDECEQHLKNLDLSYSKKDPFKRDPRSPEDPSQFNRKYWDFVTDVDFFINAVLKPCGNLNEPHPLYNVLIPADKVAEHLELALESPYLIGNPPFIVYPMDPQKLTRPFFRKPENTDTIFLVGIFYNLTPIKNPAFSSKEVVSYNSELFKDALRLGGKRYPASAQYFSMQDWQEHFGNESDNFYALREKYNPGGLLASGVMTTVNADSNPHINDDR